MGTQINEAHKDGLTIGEKISKFITDKVGTIGCAIIFCAIAFISLPAAIISKDALVIVAWIAQTFLQLVLLPIIMVGQNIQSKHSEILAQATYDNDIEMHEHVNEVHEDIKNILEIIKAKEEEIKEAIE